MYLIDTVVLSELRKTRRDAGLETWFDGRRTSDLFVSVISIGEIERGVAQRRAADPEFATLLAAWLDRVLLLYGERISHSILARRDVGVCSAHRLAMKAPISRSRPQRSNTVLPL